MVLPTGIKLDDGTQTGFGIALEIEPHPDWFSLGIEVQRAPDDGTGSPDTGNAAILPTLPPGRYTLTDALPNDAALRFYRARHVGPGYDDGSWTAWTDGFAPIQLASRSLDPGVGVLLREGRRRIDSHHESDGVLKAAVRLLNSAAVDSSSVVESGSSPNVTLTRSYTFDPQVVAFRVYRRTGNWPTTDGTQAGPLDEQYRVADRIESQFQSYYEDAGHATSDVVYDITVPLNVIGIRGTRHEASYTVSNTPPPQIDSATRNTTRTGSSCSAGSRREITLSWSTSNASDANQDMQIYERVNGGSWTLVQTVTDPVTTTSYARETGWYEDSSGAQTMIDYRLDLVTSAGPTVEDQAALSEDDIWKGIEC